MYKYMCYVSENGDKKVFYDTVAEIKELYPECAEDTSEIFDRTEMGQVLLIPDGQGNTTKICIKKEYKTNQVFVMSETYLSKYYEDKQVSNIFIYSGADNLSKGAAIAFGIGFLIVNIVVMLFWGLGRQLERNIIISSVLATVYIIFALAMKLKRDVSFGKILCIQIGGLPFCIILSLALIPLSGGWSAFYVVLIIEFFVRILILTLAISSIITSIIFFIIYKVKKCKS